MKPATTAGLQVRQDLSETGAKVEPRARAQARVLPHLFTKEPRTNSGED